MKRKFLVTGIAGTGKTFVCKRLQDTGYEAYSIEEDIPGMFAMFRKDTGELFENFSNTAEMIENSEWRCDVKKLQELLDNQKTDVAFYCGVASNMDDIIPLFDKMILLTAPAEAVYKRLMNREGTDDMGSTEESRKMVLGWKDWWEDEMRDRGAVEVSAEGPVEVVAERVTKAVLA